MPEKTLYFQNCLGVFQGGGCRGAAFVGAYKEATKRGVSFSEVVGTSAGSILAVLIAAGASPEQLEEIISRLNFSDLLSKPVKIPGYKSPLAARLIYPFRRDIYDVLTKMGMYDSSKLQIWVDAELKKLLRQTATVKFKDLIIPTTIVVSDLKSRTIKLFGNSYDEEDDVAQAVRYSCNIPIFFQPIDKRFVDGGLLSNLPAFVFKQKQESIYERILAFTLASTEEDTAEINNIEAYLKLLSTTVIDGSVNIQMGLQKNIHVINIPTGSIKATDFEKINKEDIEYLVKMGEAKTCEFFENEIANIKSQYARTDIYLDFFKAYNEIANSLAFNVEEVIISDYNTEWVYDLFPSLLGWVLGNAEITVVAKQNNDNPVHGPYQKRLLLALGCLVVDLPELPIRGTVINGNRLMNHPFAIIFNDNIGSNLPYHSKIYHGDEDFKVITLIRNVFLDQLNFKPRDVYPIVKLVENETLFDKLRNVSQYNKDDVKFDIVELELNTLTFLTRYVRGFKYRQITNLFHVFKINGIAHFLPAQIHYPSGQTSLITPPIIEEIGGQFYVIEGNTRLTFAYKDGTTKLHCVVVKGVSDPLPSTGRYRINEILITDKEKLGDSRYDDFNYGQFRKIEYAVRDPATTLI